MHATTFCFLLLCFDPAAISGYWSRLMIHTISIAALQNIPISILQKKKKHPIPGPKLLSKFNLKLCNEMVNGNKASDWLQWGVVVMATALALWSVMSVKTLCIYRPKEILYGKKHERDWSHMLTFQWTAHFFHLNKLTLTWRANNFMLI